jgi:hypothetical protein
VAQHALPELLERILIDLSDITDRVEAATSMLTESEQSGARRVVALARELALREREHGALKVHEHDRSLRKELNQHFELLGRRGARALPAAALARALLAELGGTRRDVEEALNDCDGKLSMFGL